MGLRSITDATVVIVGSTLLKKLAHKFEVAVLEASQEDRHSAILKSPARSGHHLGHPDVQLESHPLIAIDRNVVLNRLPVRLAERDELGCALDYDLGCTLDDICMRFQICLTIIKKEKGTVPNGLCPSSCHISVASFGHWSHIFTCTHEASFKRWPLVHNTLCAFNSQKQPSTPKMSSLFSSHQDAASKTQYANWLPLLPTSL